MGIYKPEPYMRELAKVVYDHMIETAIEVNGEIVYPYTIGQATKAGMARAGESNRADNDSARIHSILQKRWKLVEKGDPIHPVKKKGNQWKLIKETERLQWERAQTEPPDLNDFDPCPRCKLIESRVYDDLETIRDTIDKLMNELKSNDEKREEMK